MNKRLFALLVAGVFISAVSAAGESDFTYSRGASIEESTLPSSPQAAGVSRYISSDIAYATGSAQISIPIYTLAGHELSVPIGLEYSSGSGIKLDEVAGVAGLGWTLRAGGCITRTVCDMPDEFSSLDITHSMPSGTLLANLEGKVNNTSTLSYLTSVCRHRVDSRLDRYSYSVCGLSGSFVISQGEVVQLSGDGVLITLTRDASGAIESFTITGPDGVRYTFSEKETGTHDATAGNPNVSPLTGAKDLWSATTAWYLTRIESRTGLEVATLSYTTGLQWERTVAVSSQSRSFVTGSVDQTAMNSSHSDIVQRYTTKLLAGITLNGYSVSFTYSEERTRNNHSGIQQWNYPARLTGVSVRRPDGRALRSVVVGTERESRDGRVILSRLEFKDSAGDLEDVWRFKYNTLAQSVSHYAQDWFGYYNGVPNATNGICPFSFNPTQTATGGVPDGSKASYMALRECDHDGAVQTFLYEGADADGTVSAGVRIKNIEIGSSGLYRSFSYEQPAPDGPVSPSLGMYLTVRPPLSGSDATGTGTLSSGTVTWTFTLHETPVGGGANVRDTRVYYGKVSESLHTMILRAEQKTMTVRYFDTSQTLKGTTEVFSRFPLSVKTLYRQYPPYGTDLDPYTAITQEYVETGPSREPKLLGQEEYAYDAASGSFRKVSETRCEYAPAGEERQVLVSYEASQVWYPAGVGNITYQNIYHYPVYATSSSGRNAVKKHIVNYYYDVDGTTSRDSVCVVMSYIDRDVSLTLPSRLQSSGVTEGSVERILEYSYPERTSVLYSQHAVSTILQTDYSINYPELIIVKPSKPIISTAAVTLPLPVYNPTSRKVKSERTEYDYFTLEGTGRTVYLPRSHIGYHEGRECWREDIRRRDSRGNIAEYKSTGGPITSLIWSYAGQYPVIKVENCGIDTIRTYLADRSLQVDSVTTAAAGQSKSSLLVYRSVLSQFIDAHITTYVYEQGVGVKCITDPAGTSTEYEYDASGRLARVRDNNGNKVEEYEYNLLIGSSAAPAVGTGARSIRTRTFLDSGGQNSVQSVSWWDVLGLHIQDIKIGGAPDGKDAVFHWGSDLLLRDDTYEYLPYSASDTEGQFQADAVSASKAYNGSQKPYTVRHYESSTRDKVLSEALPDFDGEHETRYEESAADGFKKLAWYSGYVYERGTYDSTQIIRTVTRDADGRSRAVYRDHFGKTLGTSVIKQDRTEDITYYIYDPYDKLSAVIGAGVSTSAAKKNYWRYAYDTLGRMSSKGIPGSSEEIKYAYDSENRVVRQTQGTSVREYEYDAFGRVTKVYFTRGAAERKLFEEHFYDRYPECVYSIYSVSPASGESYIGKESYARFAEIGLNDEVIGYAHILDSYDLLGRRIDRWTRYSDGTTIIEDFENDFRGNIISDSVKYCEEVTSVIFNTTSRYDLWNRLTQKTETLSYPYQRWSSALTYQYRYDLQGRVTNIILTPDGGRALCNDFEYTPQGWISLVGYADNDNSSNYCCERLEHSYAGKIITRIMKWYGNEERSDSTYYAYDCAGRLSEESFSAVADSIVQYSYDPRGNILSIRSGADEKTFTYSADLLMGLSIGGTGYAFTYDNRGRLESDPMPGGLGSRIHYSDYLDKLTGTQSVAYSYIANGDKLQARGVNDTSLVYRGPFVFKENGENGERVLEGVETDGGRMSRFRTLLYLRDHLGSVIGVLDPNAAEMLMTFEYTAYGERSETVRASSEDMLDGVTARLSFTGKESQKENFGIGYIDFGARLYSPVTGRWLTPDPKSEDYYGVSPYSYCAGDPVNFVDPDGRDWYSYEKTTENDDGTFQIETLYAWTYATSQDELDKSGIVGVYRGEAIIVFNGYMDERLDKDGRLSRTDGKPADVTIYGSNGPNDINTYMGLSVSSNPKIYPMVAQGEYLLMKSQMSTSAYAGESFTYRVKCLHGTGNPYLIPPEGGINKNTGEKYISGVFLHRTNNDGKASNSSRGCLVIDGRRWKEVETQLKESQKIYLVLKRN